MYRGTIHRGIAALLFVTFLAVAGAQPAAAAPNAGFLGRLSSLWSAVVGGESDTLWNRLTGREGKPAVKSPRATAKRGFGIDPNGTVFEIPQTPGPGGTGTNGGNS
jgi:hypothetical protein